MSEDQLTVDDLIFELQSFIYVEGMKLNKYEIKLNGEDKMYYTIEERPKSKSENYNNNKYLLIHQHLIKILKLRCYQNNVMFSQTKIIVLFGEKYLYFPLKKNFKFQTIANKVNSTLKPGLGQVKSNIISDVPSRVNWTGPFPVGSLV